MKKVKTDEPSTDTVAVVSMKYLDGATNPAYVHKEETQSHAAIEMSKLQQVGSVPTFPDTGVISNGLQPIPVQGSLPLKADVPSVKDTSHQDLTPCATANGISAKHHSQLELVDRTIVEDADAGSKSKTSKLVEGKRCRH